MKISMPVVLGGLLFVTGCNTVKSSRNDDPQSNTATSSDIVNTSWTLCSEDYKLSSPDGYFQTITFSKDGLYSMQRKSFMGTDCSRQDNQIETLSWVYEYKVGPATSSEYEIVTKLKSVTLSLSSDSTVKKANSNKLWGYSDWKLNEIKSLLNRSEKGGDPVSFQIGEEHKGVYYIENNKLHFNQGSEKSDAALYKEVGLSRAQ